MENLWYYTCNGKKIYDKFEAIRENEQSHKGLYYHAPPFFDMYPTHIEPEQQWTVVLKNRAQQLRDNYDYLILYFSGGCDSKLVLDTFVKNDICIDEIVMNRCGFNKADYEMDDAEQYVQSIKHKLLGTKISVVSASYDDYKSIYSDPYWYEQFNGENSVPHFRLNHLLSNFDEHKSHGKTAQVYGNCKPSVVFRHNEWYFYFLDLHTDSGTKSYTVRENFYSDCPTVHTKQSHMLKQYIETNVERKKWNKISTNWYQDTWNTGCGRLIYNTDFIQKKIFRWNEANKLYINNHKLYYRQEKEYLALKQAIDSMPDVVENWYRSLTDLSLISNKWFNNTRPEFDSVGVFSKFYSMTSNKNKIVDELYPNGFTLEVE